MTAIPTKIYQKNVLAKIRNNRKKHLPGVFGARRKKHKIEQ